MFSLNLEDLQPPRNHPGWSLSRSSHPSYPQAAGGVFYFIYSSRKRQEGYFIFYILFPQADGE
jgi:hypothetical protein